MIRFHLDEHIPHVVARALQRRDIDVSTTVSAGIRTASDITQWNYAQREHRVLVTQDEDFLRLSVTHTDHAGIVYCMPGTCSIGHMVEALVLIYEVYTPEEMVGRLSTYKHAAGVMNGHTD